MSASLRFSDIQARARTAAAAALTTSPAEAARAACAEADAFLAETVTALGIEAKVAALGCRAGCSTCCHQVVGVTSAELDLVMEAIAALPDATRAAVARRAQDAAARGKHLSQGEWWQAKLPCPLLAEDGLCLVHASRPLACRAFNSADAEICRRSFDGDASAGPVPVLAAQHGIYGHAQAGLAQALAAAAPPKGWVLAIGLAERLGVPQDGA